MNNFVRELGRITKKHPTWHVDITADRRNEDITVTIQDGAMFATARIQRYLFERDSAGFDSILARELRELEERAMHARFRYSKELPAKLIVESTPNDEPNPFFKCLQLPETD